MSDYPITFHYMTPPKMYLMEYLLYHVRLYGVTQKHQQLNKLNTTLADTRRVDRGTPEHRLGRGELLKRERAVGNS